MGQQGVKRPALSSYRGPSLCSEEAPWPWLLTPTLSNCLAWSQWLSPFETCEMGAAKLTFGVVMRINSCCGVFCGACHPASSQELLVSRNLPLSLMTLFLQIFSVHLYLWECLKQNKTKQPRAFMYEATFPKEVKCWFFSSAYSFRMGREDI